LVFDGEAHAADVLDSFGELVGVLPRKFEGLLEPSCLICAQANVGGKFFNFSALFSDTAKKRSEQRPSKTAGAAEETPECAAEGAAGCGSTALAEQQREGAANYGVAYDTAKAIASASSSSGTTSGSRWLGTDGLGVLCSGSDSSAD
jgi:hypothetical protein